jgi:hypothetical protein
VGGPNHVIAVYFWLVCTAHCSAFQIIVCIGFVIIITIILVIVFLFNCIFKQLDCRLSLIDGQLVFFVLVQKPFILVQEEGLAVVCLQ